MRIIRRDSCGVSGLGGMAIREPKPGGFLTTAVLAQGRVGHLPIGSDGDGRRKSGDDRRRCGRRAGDNDEGKVFVPLRPSDIPVVSVAVCVVILPGILLQFRSALVFAALYGEGEFAALRVTSARRAGDAEDEKGVRWCTGSVCSFGFAALISSRRADCCGWLSGRLLPFIVGLHSDRYSVAFSRVWS